MNCLEFRRQMETAPAQAGSGAHEHARECPACTDFSRRVAAFDRALGEALRVPVPENLAARILMRQSFPRRSTTRGWLALAACLVLAIALAAGGYLRYESALEHELVALVQAADYALAADEPVDTEALAEALRPVGLGVGAPMGRVSYAGRCLVRGNLSGHLVIRDDAEPVTVFLMPDERMARRSRFEHQGWSGVLVPAGDGTLGFVAPAGKSVESVIERVSKAVRWRG